MKVPSMAICALLALASPAQAKDPDVLIMVRDSRGHITLAKPNKTFEVRETTCVAKVYVDGLVEAVCACTRGTAQFGAAGMGGVILFTGDPTCKPETLAITYDPGEAA